jgi:hypothetical protein
MTHDHDSSRAFRALFRTHRADAGGQQEFIDRHVSVRCGSVRFGAVRASGRRVSARATFSSKFPQFSLRIFTSRT